MRSLLQRSTFDHDLDVYHAEGTSKGLTITADGEQGHERRDTRPEWTTPGAMENPDFFTVSYNGPGSITSLTLDGIGANPTGLGFGPLSAGLVFDPRPFAGMPALGAPPFYQQGFPFTSATPGVTAKFSLPGIGDANAQQYERMTVSFPAGTRSASFGVDRDEAVTAYGVAMDGNSADALGQGVLYPSGKTVGAGMIFTARTSTGRTIVGTIRNRIGSGWTPVDGYGYLNAEEAVKNAR
jgi:hypothetical protein